MTNDRLNERLAIIGWTERELARRLSVTSQRVQRWSNGVYPVPDDVAKFVEAAARAIERLPVPEVARRAAR